MKNTIAALYSEKNSSCVVTRGSPANSSTNPATDSGAPPPTIPEEPLKKLSRSLKHIFTEYLNINASNGDTIDEGIDYTYTEEERQVSKLVSLTGSTS